MFIQSHTQKRSEGMMKEGGERGEKQLKHPDEREPSRDRVATRSVEKWQNGELQMDLSSLQFDGVCVCIVSYSRILINHPYVVSCVLSDLFWTMPAIALPLQKSSLHVTTRKWLHCRTADSMVYRFSACPRHRDPQCEHTLTESCRERESQLGEDETGVDNPPRDTSHIQAKCRITEQHTTEECKREAEERTKDKADRVPFCL